MTRPAQELVLPTRSGDELPVYFWDAPRASCAVVALHGMMSHAGWFGALASSFVERGVSFFAADRRGSGMATGLSGSADPQAWVEDVATVVARARHQASRVTLLCWCWGARPGV